MKAHKRRRGQVWSLDYTVAFVLFTLSLLFAVTVLFRTSLLDDGFDDLWRETEQLSGKLMGEGYPADWRVDDSVSLGLLTDDLLSRRKVERFAAMIDDDYEATKDPLDVLADYSISFEHLNGSLLSFGEHCQLGLESETKSISNETIPIAYYYRGGLHDLRTKLLALGADEYSDAELGQLLERIDDYWLVVMEEPALTSVARPYDGEKGESIEEYVRKGGTLLVVGDLNLTEAFDLNLTLVNSSANASGAPTNDTFLNMTGLTLNEIDSDAWAMQRGSEKRYEPLASLSDGRDVLATFTYGDGDVYYLGGLGGQINETGESLVAFVENRLEAFAVRDRATCAAVNLPTATARHIVHVERLVGYEGELLRMNINMWVTH